MNIIKFKIDNYDFEITEFKLFDLFEITDLLLDIDKNGRKKENFKKIFLYPNIKQIVEMNSENGVPFINSKSITEEVLENIGKLDPNNINIFHSKIYKAVEDSYIESKEKKS